MFHAHYMEEFVDLDEELDLPPRLAPNQPVTALQVARLLRRFANTQHTRSPAQNEALLDQVVALLDRIVVRAGVPIPPPSRSSTTTTSTTADELELNERYAEHVVLRCVYARVCACACACVLTVVCGLVCGVGRTCRPATR